MTKIKSIQIKDFRIYGSDQEFNFEKQDSLANLMVIYAPNGFGKTSFFDAVEWCYSSKIRRFESEILDQQIKNRDYSSGDRILLTNRVSFKNGRSGQVIIKTADNKTIKRTASERKANNSNFKYDYKTISSLDSDFEGHTLERLVKTNILTQDQIDEFLRNTAPEERFYQLQSFWPEGESAITILQKVDSYLNMLNLEKRTITGKIIEEEKTINEHLSSRAQIEPLNKLIEDTISKSTIGLAIDPLQNNVDITTYDTIINTTQSFIERAKINSSKVEESVILLEDLSSRFQNLLDISLNKSVAESELVKLSEYSKFIADRNSNTDLRTVEEKALITSKLRLEKLSRLLELEEKFTARKNEIIEHRTALERHRNEISRLLDNNTIYQESYNKLNAAAENFNSRKELIQNALETWDTELSSYIFWKAELKSSTKRYEEIKSELEKDKQLLSGKIKLRVDLNSLLESKAYEELKEHYSDSTEVLIKNWKSNKLALEREENTIRSLRKQLDNAASLEETFEKIINWGQHYVQQTNKDHCPLCATKFKNINDLLQTIDKQKSQGSEISRIKESIVEAEKNEELFSIALEQSVLALERFITENTQLQQEEIEKLQLQIERQESEFKSTENLKNNASQSAFERLKKLLPDETDISLSTEYDFDRLKDHNNKQQDNLRANQERLHRILEAKKGLITINDNKISNLRNKRLTEENNISIASSDSSVVEGQRLTKELELDFETITKEKLDGFLNTTNSHVNVLESKVQEYTDRIAEIQGHLEKTDLKFTDVDLPGMLLKKGQEIKGYTEDLENYYAKFKLLSDDEPTAEGILGISEKLKHQKEKLELEIESLEKLCISLKVLEKNVTLNASQKRRTELIENLKPIEAALKLVSDARLTSQNYINVEINKHFNEDVINQIYARIEPHPDLNHIKISPKVTDKGPVLDIKAISKDEELDPSLYLSAGQLNVLSLSIFLAKAFETKSEEIDTIFMDDPIQNLSDINVLSFIDLIRTMITKYDRQIVISSHDENFYRLIRNKMPASAFNVRYYELESFGAAKSIE